MTIYARYQPLWFWTTFPILWLCMNQEPYFFIVDCCEPPNISKYLQISPDPLHLCVVCCQKSVDPPTQLESACFHTYISITPHAAKRTAAPIWPSKQSTTNHDEPFQVMIGFHVWLEDFASHMLICWRFQGWWIVMVIVMSRVAFRLAGCLARSMVFVERLKGTELTSTAWPLSTPHPFQSNTRFLQITGFINQPSIRYPETPWNLMKFHHLSKSTFPPTHLTWGSFKGCKAGRHILQTWQLHLEERLKSANCKGKEQIIEINKHIILMQFWGSVLETFQNLRPTLTFQWDW